MNIATRLVSYDRCPGDRYRPVATPIYQTATFEQESALEFGEFDYSRSGNPTRRVLETQLAELEGAVGAYAFASGLAALTAVMRLVRPGEEIIANDDLYGGTYRLLSRFVEPFGVAVKYVDLTDLDAAARAISGRTRLVHIETPTNPLQRVCDIRGLAGLAHKRGALLSVDSTAMTPVLQRPLGLGADIVVHSATKYLCGHSDVMAGSVAVADAALGEQVYAVQNGEGAGLSPFDSFLLLRGMKTLGVRLRAQQASAGRIAAVLVEHPVVKQVHFVGLSGHPGSALHAAQADGPGAVVSFETGSVETSRRIVESLTLFGIAVSFGGVNSSVSLPCRMSHASIPAAVREARALPEDLVRVSVGIEHTDDLVADVSRVLNEVGRENGCDGSGPSAAQTSGECLVGS